MIPGLDELFNAVRIQMEHVGVTRKGNMRLWEEGSLSIEVVYHNPDGNTRRAIGVVNVEAILNPFTHEIVGSRTTIIPCD